MGVTNYLLIGIIGMILQVRPYMQKTNRVFLGKKKHRTTQRRLMPRHKPRVSVREGGNPILQGQDLMGGPFFFASTWKPKQPGF